MEKQNLPQTAVLLHSKERRPQVETPQQTLGLIQITGKRRKIIDTYENKDTFLSIAPTQIVVKDKTYQLHSPLFCKIKKEGKSYIIENEMLDLYAAGSSIEEAEQDLYTEFDASFEILNSLPDTELSTRLLRAKSMMHAFVKEIIQQ